MLKGGRADEVGDILSVLRLCSRLGSFPVVGQRADPETVVTRGVEERCRQPAEESWAALLSLNGCSRSSTRLRPVAWSSCSTKWESSSSMLRWRAATFTFSRRSPRSPHAGSRWSASCYWRPSSSLEMSIRIVCRAGTGRMAQGPRAISSILSISLAGEEQIELIAEAIKSDVKVDPAGVHDVVAKAIGKGWGFDPVASGPACRMLAVAPSSPLLLRAIVTAPVRTEPAPASSAFSHPLSLLVFKSLDHVQSLTDCTGLSVFGTTCARTSSKQYLPLLTVTGGLQRLRRFSEPSIAVGGHATYC